MTTLDVSNLSALTTIYADSIGLTTIDVSNCSSLKTLSVKNNQLTSINASNLAKLEKLYADNNVITNINLTNCTSLQFLYAKNNKLSSLTYPQSTFLYDLRVANNTITSLNTSMLEYLQTLDIQNNNISSLDVKGKFYLTSFNAKGNPLLQCIQVSSLGVTTANNYQKDSLAKFSTNCKVATGYTAIPDSAFEASLRQNDLDDSPVNDGKVPTNFIQESTVNQLSLSNKGIKDLTGIRAFKNLTYLDVSNNKLLTLYVDSMNLTNLIAAGNPDLFYISCNFNKISYLGVNSLPSLVFLFISNNKIQSLPLASFTNLAFFDCENNELTSIFNSAMKKLVFVNTRGNKISRVYFDATSDPIGEKPPGRLAKTNAFASLQHLDCGNNLITSIDVSNLPSLKYLNVSNTSIDSLNITNLTVLDTLNATSNTKLNCIQVANTSVANAKVNFTKDAKANYSINCRSAAGIENEIENQYVIYPNPTSGQVTIQLGSAANVSISNAIGTKVYEQNLEQGKHSVLLNNVNAGIYFVEIQNKNTRTIEKLLISK